MGDSDDDYDRKRRDKFRGERSVGTDRRRDDWVDRGRPKSDYRDYRSTRDRNSYSPGRDYPPLKRMRGDYDEPRGRYGGHDPYGGGYGWGGAPHDHYGVHGPSMGYGGMPREHHHREAGGPASDVQTQPCLMTLKQFLATQDDSISDSDAIEKYNEYKVEFRRQQLNEFFVTHKDEEWFKLKYHPEESVKRKEEQQQFLKKRVDVFVELLDNKTISEVSVDTCQSEKLLRVLDTVVIKLEGGTDEDIAALDEKPEDLVVEAEKKSPEATKASSDAEQKESAEASNGSAEKKPSPKRKRSSSNSSDSSSASSADSDSEEKPTAAAAEEADKEEEEGAEKKKDEDEAAEKEDAPEKMDESTEEDKSADKADKEEEKDETAKEEGETAVVEKTETPSGRDLHKTSSIFLRNLAPTITKAEVEAVCRRYDGFLRVAIADPLVERRWFRRGWVSFRRDVNIKEICWNLNNIRLRDCELGAIVNRDLSRRVRPVNGITNHKAILRNDIKVCAKIVHNLDEKNSLWKDKGEAQSENMKATFGFHSKNPVLQNITDYLIEEASAEEDELLGLSTNNADEKGEGEAATDDSFEREANLLSVLDKLILYLRIVHSVDFYNHCEYPYEDEMPNRCGIIHARMPVPTSKVTSQDVQDYIKNFESKMEPFLQRNVPVTDEELKKLGSKDPEQEVEKFITANSQELAKDKWLCPLSGKKFKGPDFIRKHILNKHAEKVEEVRKEVEYFNNYLKDSKRPQLPEHPANSKKEGGAPKENPMMGGYRASYPGPGYGAPYGNPYGPPPMAMHRGRGPGFGQRRPIPADMRPIIHYRDLDAPREPDEFL